MGQFNTTEKKVMNDRYDSSYDGFNSKLYKDTPYNFKQINIIKNEKHFKEECVVVRWNQYDESKVLESNEKLDSNNVFAKGVFKYDSDSEHPITCHQVKSNGELKYVCNYRNMTISYPELDTVIVGLTKMTTTVHTDE